MHFVVDFSLFLLVSVVVDCHHRRHRIVARQMKDNDLTRKDLPLQQLGQHPNRAKPTKKNMIERRRHHTKNRSHQLTHLCLEGFKDSIEFIPLIVFGITCLWTGYHHSSR